MGMDCGYRVMVVAMKGPGFRAREMGWGRL